jgi:hypothetical protein
MTSYPNLYMVEEWLNQFEDNVYINVVIYIAHVNHADWYYNYLPLLRFLTSKTEY